MIRPQSIRLFLLALWLAAPLARAADPEAVEALAKKFQAANQAFETGSYKDAIAGYEALLAGGAASGVVHYNLGDAYFRDKELGRAIFHFRKAREALPRDPDVRFNLGFARARATDRIEQKGLGAAIEAALPFTEREALRALAAAAALFFAFLAARTLTKREWLFWPELATGLVFALTVAVAAEKALYRPHFGVVTAAEAGVYSGTGKDTTLLFSLHEGAEFSVENGEADWVRIQLADGKRGWLKRQDAIF